MRRRTRKRTSIYTKLLEEPTLERNRSQILVPESRLTCGVISLFGKTRKSVFKSSWLHNSHCKLINMAVCVHTLPGAAQSSLLVLTGPQPRVLQATKNGGSSASAAARALYRPRSLNLTRLRRHVRVRVTYMVVYRRKKERGKFVKNVKVNKSKFCPFELLLLVRDGGGGDRCRWRLCGVVPVDIFNFDLLVAAAVSLFWIPIRVRCR